MKIRKSRLEQIIKEEVDNAKFINVREDFVSDSTEEEEAEGEQGSGTPTVSYQESTGDFQSIVVQEIMRAFKESRKPYDWHKGENPENGEKAEERDDAEVVPYGKSAFEDAEVVGKDLTEEENWPKKAAADVKKKGTEGEFTKYCGGDVTQACVDKAAKGSSPKRKKQAAFAANINSHDDLTYPKKKGK